MFIKTSAHASWKLSFTSQSTRRFLRPGCMNTSISKTGRIFLGKKMARMAIPIVFALLITAAAARSLRAVGVQQIPLLHSQHPPWIHPDHQNFSGPLGAYLNHLLVGCGFTDGFNILNWANTSRMAEYDVLVGTSDIGFPVYRLWATAPTTLSEEAGGGHFLPVLSSPGISYLPPSSKACANHFRNNYHRK